MNNDSYPLWKVYIRRMCSVFGSSYSLQIASWFLGLNLVWSCRLRFFQPKPVKGCRFEYRPNLNHVDSGLIMAVLGILVSIFSCPILKNAQENPLFGIQRYERHVITNT